MSLKLGENFRESIKSILNIMLVKNQPIPDILAFLDKNQHVFINYQNEFEDLKMSIEKYRDEPKGIEKPLNRKPILIIARPSNLHEDFDETYIRKVIEYNVFIKHILILNENENQRTGNKEYSLFTSEYSRTSHNAKAVVEFLREESTKRAQTFTRHRNYHCFIINSDSLIIDSSSYDEFIKRGGFQF